MQAFAGATPEEIAWCGGLFEGEGCFSIHKGAVRKDGSHLMRLVVLIKMTDLDVLQKFWRIARVGNITTNDWYEKKGHKKQYIWRAALDDAVEVGFVLYLHLGERRRAKFMEIMGQITEQEVRPYEKKKP